MLSKQRGRPLSVPCFSSLNRMLRIAIRLQRLVKLCRKVQVGTGIFSSYQDYSDVLLAVVKCFQAIFLKPLLQELSNRYYTKSEPPLKRQKQLLLSNR